MNGSRFGGQHETRAFMSVICCGGDSFHNERLHRVEKVGGAGVSCDRHSLESATRGLGVQATTRFTRQLVPVRDNTGNMDSMRFLPANIKSCFCVGGTWTIGQENGDSSDLEDVVVEAGSVRVKDAALVRAKSLKAMLASGLPSKVRKTKHGRP